MKGRHSWPRAWRWSPARRSAAGAMTAAAEVRPPATSRPPTPRPPTSAAASRTCSPSSSSLGADAKPAEAVETLKKSGDDLGEIGTPEDMPDDARAGFELVLDEIEKLDDDATREDINGLGADISEDQQTDMDAYEKYLQDDLRRRARRSWRDRLSRRLTSGRRSDDLRGPSGVADHRAAGAGPLDHAAVEVGDVVPLLGEVGRRLRGPGTHLADDERAAGGDLGQPLARAPSAGCAPPPSMWPCAHSTGSRTSSTLTPSGSGSGRSLVVTVGICMGPLTSAASTSAGRRAACRRSGRWRSTAGSSRRTRPRAPRRRRPGTSGRCGRARPCGTSSRP